MRLFTIRSSLKSSTGVLDFRLQARNCNYTGAPSANCFGYYYSCCCCFQAAVNLFQLDINIEGSDNDDNMNSVTITPVYRASGAGKRKGSIPLKTIPKASLVQVEPVDLSLKKEEGELVVDLSLRR